MTLTYGLKPVPFKDIGFSPTSIGDFAPVASHTGGPWRHRLAGTEIPFLVVHGIVDGMKLKIDKAGRIVVPKPLRERLGFRADTQLEAIEQPEGVLLKRIEQRPSMAKVDGLWVHQGTAEPGANWERVLNDLREERIDSIMKA
jgi:AbrB family looped-hinge helix DNA binding protein